MADVKRVSGKMQLDTEGGGVVRATYEMAVETNKAVGSFTGEIGITIAELGNTEATGRFTAEIGVTKAELGNKQATGSSTRQICFTKADLENKEAAGSFTGGIGDTQAVLNKDVAGSSIGEIIGVTKVVLGNKEAAGSFISEIGVTKAGLGNKEAAGGFTGEIGVTKAGLGNKEAAGTGMVTAASGIKLPAWSEKPREERKAEQVVALVTKETVPDSYIARIKRRPMRKISPLSGDLYDEFADDPSDLEILQASIAHINYLVDVEQDCLRQHAEKGYAEIGVDYTSGVRKVFILPILASGGK